MNKISALCVDETIYLYIDDKLIDYLFDFVIPIQEKGVELYLFTCTCGVPGCAGWHEGFNVETTTDIVSWALLDLEKSLVPVNCVFDRNSYEETQREVPHMLYAMAERRSKLPPEDFEHNFLEFSNREELDQMLERMFSWAKEWL